MKILYESSKIKTAGGTADWIRRAVLSWLAAVTLETLVNPVSLAGVEGLAEVSPGRIAAVMAAVFAALWLLSRRTNTGRWERWAIAGVFAALTARSLAASFTWPFLTACVLVLAVLVVYARRGWDGRGVRVRPVAEDRRFALLAAAGAVVYFLFVSVWTVCRVRSFSTPTYDFGIFAQMFHSMKTTGLPITTVERDGALSHFAVHVSPIYYLLLPFYCLVPEPETLQVLQAAVLASAVIPLWKLGRLHGLNPPVRCLLCGALLLYPAYAGGTSYDIHENAFLTPLILWLFYGLDRKSGWITAVAAVLTLMVKEDAAVYGAVIALWLLVKTLARREGKWGLVAGSALLAGSLLWFLGVTGYLARSGDGVMTYRYSNFIYDGSGSLLSVVKAVLILPMKAVYECVDPEKLEFIALTLLPLLGLPLVTRRYERYILLIPYVLVNLMSDYQYQHSIFFQYTYGSTACLFYLTAVNAADLRAEKRQIAALGAAVCVAAGCFGAQVVPKAVKYPGYCVKYAGYYDELRRLLAQIPEDASAAATTYYTTYLSGRETLYDVRYASKEHLLECEYIVLSVTDEKSYKAYGGFEGLTDLLEREGYQLIDGYEGKMEIYRRA
ncbi:MAG: DUF2079 domain-containing protein [Oscillospiraceae bacterium]|nr:DUF2079 domain-containing protein [Oscillospiraceae bacterium]